MSTVLENHSIYVLIFDLSGNTVGTQASGYQKLAKNDRFWHFNELLSTQNVHVARFARNVECDFFVIFKHYECHLSSTKHFRK